MVTASNHELENSLAISFLPLLYIAWSDDELTESEITFIKEKINHQDWLNTGEKAMLEKWLNPALPPTEREMRTWLKIIRKHVKKHVGGREKGLAEMGEELANKSAAYEGKIPPAALIALQEIETTMGVVGCEACEELLASSYHENLQDIPESSFPVSILKNLIDGDTQAMKERMRALLSRPDFAYQQPTSKELYREKVYDWCKILAEEGLGNLSYPLISGGKEDMQNYITVFEMLGYHDLSLAIKFGVQFGLFGGSIQMLGTNQHHIKFLKPAGTLELPGCFAMTESAHGSNVRGLETTATFDKATQEFIINTPTYTAHKEYIGNAAAHAQMATVFAQLIIDGESFGVHAFLVPIRDKDGDNMMGVRIEDSGHKLGLNGVDNGRLWFYNVRIPRVNLLDKYAQVSPNGNYTSPIASEGKRFFTMVGTLVGGRICVPIAGLSSAKKALTIAIKYANRRRQFGPPGKPETRLMDYLTHQRRLLPLLAKTYALDFAHKKMAKLYLDNTEEDTRELEALAAGLKSISTWHTTALLQECREACGGNGYLQANRFADMKADTDIFTTFEGDNVVLLQLVAKARLSEFKQEFSDLKFFGLLKYVTSIAGVKISEMNPIITRNTSPDHLRDYEFQISAFDYREKDLVESVARRLRHRIQKTKDSYAAFIECQDHLVTMAKAYIEKFILESFQDAIQDAPSAVQPILTSLKDLYALSTLEDHSGWYQEQGYIEGPKSKAIRKEVNRLVTELRPECEGLVDAFAIPAEILSAPIADWKQ